MTKSLKRSLSLITLLALILTSLQLQVLASSEENSTISVPQIAVLSDTHYFSPQLGVSGKAFEQYLSEDHKLLAQSEAILKKAIESITSSDAKIVLVTGDLTKDGELVNHNKVAGYLQQLRGAGKKVYVINGNHDINNPHSVKYVGDTKEAIDTISPSDFKTIYEDFGYKEAIAKDPDSLSYVVEPVKGLRILAMDSCLYDNNITLGGPVTSGEFSQKRLDWILDQLEKARKENTHVIGMMHHGAMPHYTMQEQLAGEYIINNWKNVSAELANAGMEFVFSGHAHSQDISQIKTPEGHILNDIETGSLLTYPSPYRLVTFQGDNRVKIDSKFIDAIDFDLGEDSFPIFSKAFLVNKYKQSTPFLFEQVLKKMGYRQEKITSKVSEFSTQQIISGLTGSDLVTQALLINHQGDEIASEGITPAYNTMLASNDFSTQFLGRTLISLTTDNAPADNNIILALTPLIPYVIKAEINLIIGQTQMSVNGVTNEIDLGRSTVSVVKNGRTLLPIRAIIEALGGTVDWDGATQKVTLTVDGRKIEMWINKPNMLVNGVEREIDPGRGTVPEILNERTMLPIRAIIEAFRGTVSWDENTKMVTITY